MATNFGRIPTMGSVGTFNAPASTNSFMNRAKHATTNFLSSTTNMIMVGLGLILIVFVFLVIYNKTVGEKVSKAWNEIKTILRNKGIIEVGIDPGNTGTPTVTAKMDPEPSVVLPPLTATLLPEPVTVPKPADNPPNDNMNIPKGDRPSGMPGSGVSKSILEAVKEDVV
jgi:hypothetical protein